MSAEGPFTPVANSINVGAKCIDTSLSEWWFNRMRFISVMLWLLATIFVSACDFWPKGLEPLAESITQQVSGETTAWLLGGDVVAIDVASSPLYRADPLELEALAIEIAEQTIAFSSAPLESIAVTFHEGAVSEDPEKMREFIFLVMESRPVLQPQLDINATGPLTLVEIRTQFIDRMDESLTREQRDCVLEEVEKLARIAGDPETLDPASVEFLSAETWSPLDAFGRRLILAQSITTKAFFVCN